MSGPATNAGLRACASRLASRSIAARWGIARAGHGARDLVAHLILGAHLRVPVVHRDRHEHRAPGRQRCGVRRARQRVWYVLRAGRLPAPLHQRVRHPRGVAVGEVGLEGHQRAVLLARRHHQRGLVRLRVEDRPHAVPQPRRSVQVHERRASRGLRVAVRDLRPPLPPGGPGCNGSPPGSRSAWAAPWSPGCRTAWSCPCARSSSIVASRTVLIASALLAVDLRSDRPGGRNGSRVCPAWGPRVGGGERAVGCGRILEDRSASQLKLVSLWGLELVSEPAAL